MTTINILLMIVIVVKIKLALEDYNVYSLFVI